uniref:Uncharacterized protein n=1 Tax=Salix viminalis TaxID=40686 RepID=A0A6N2K298_SALVM
MTPRVTPRAIKLGTLKQKRKKHGPTTPIKRNKHGKVPLITRSPNPNRLGATAAPPGKPPPGLSLIRRGEVNGELWSLQHSGFRKTMIVFRSPLERG